jgi:hypothetical protein
MVGNGLSEQKRLEMFVETIKYCQKMKKQNMPSTLYSRLLRCMIGDLWNLCGYSSVQKAREQMPKKRSKASLGKKFGKGQLIFEHAIPIKLEIDELMALSSPAPNVVKDILDRYNYIVIIANEDDKKLRDAGLAAKMPDGWDQSNPYARYKVAGIDLCDNPSHSQP